MHFHWKILFFGFLIYLNLSDGENVEEKSSAYTAANITEDIASLGRKLITSLKSTSKANENLLISPTNIFHALGLLHLAAGGNTLKEISNLMGIPTQNYSKSDFHTAVSNTYKNIITDDSNSVVLNIADALFLQNGSKIKKDYLDNAVEKYQAEIGNVDFNASEEAVNKINHWVSQKTKNRITKVVDSFSSDTLAVLISTLYFKAQWKYAFNSTQTHKDKFFTGENEVDAQMMNLTKRLKYVNNSELQFESVDLPYFGRTDYSMNIILPYPNQNITNLVPKLQNISINQMMENSSDEAVNVKLPKTKFHVGISLNETLKHLGVKDLFTDKADLTDLADADLLVSQIFHSAEIEIREEGTVATAATVSHTLFASRQRPLTDPVRFHVNRPFIINIYDTRTTLTLFTGIVYKPEVNS